MYHPFLLVALSLSLFSSTLAFAPRVGHPKFPRPVVQPTTSFSAHTPAESMNLNLAVDSTAAAGVHIVQIPGHKGLPPPKISRPPSTPGVHLAQPQKEAQFRHAGLVHLPPNLAVQPVAKLREKRTPPMPGHQGLAKHATNPSAPPAPGAHLAQIAKHELRVGAPQILEKRRLGGGDCPSP